MTLRPNQGLDAMLESAVVVAWIDLLPKGKSGSAHVEYRLSAGLLANLRVWISKTRGHWMLVCEYPGPRACAGDSTLLFSNGYRSDVLTQILQFVVKHQTAFAHAPELGRDSLVQVQAPNEQEEEHALQLINAALAPEALCKPMALVAAH
ncbi:MAG TPA: hypothetical protein VLV49_04020 [Terriglobales bacterium]|nr:hypothetical protein [Terriglobales bacterium]